MMRRSAIYGTRFLIGAVLVVGGLLAGPMKASAQLGPCRSDPYVLLSNGSQLDLSATIGDNVSDVSSVLYVLHGPVGVSPVAVVPTDGAMGWVERFQYYSDDSAGHYDTYTTVATLTSSIPITATSALAGTPSIGLKSVSGLSGQAVYVPLASS